MPSRDEFKLVVAAYHTLRTEIEYSGISIDVDPESQQHALQEAAKDVANHNAVLRMEPKSLDLIKCLSFVGCHLLTFLNEREEIEAMVKALLKALDGLVSAERGDNYVMNSKIVEHLRRLVLIEILSQKDGDLTGSIWGHGFWRVGLYVSCLSAARLFETPNNH